MKNFIFASAALCVAATISAQEVEVVEVQTQPQEEQTTAATTKAYRTEAGRFGVETAIDLKDGFSFKEKDYTEEGFDGFKGGRITATYTLSDQLSLRCGFGLHVSKTYKHDKESVPNNEFEGIKKTTDTKGHETKSQFEVLPGIVYSFKGTERLEPYVGVEGSFGFGKTRTVSNIEKTTNEAGVEDTTYSSKNTSSAFFFGVNGFSGFNFFLCKDLFIGAELGFGFRVTPTDPVTKEEIEDSTVEKVEAPENDDKHFGHTTEINMLFHPSIRLGWRF